MAKWNVVVEEKRKFEFLNIEAETALEARVIAIDLLENNKELEPVDTNVGAVALKTYDADLFTPEEQGLGEVFLQIANISGATLEQVEKWAMTVDEDRFIGESAEELANEFIDTL